jgi:hypothetical protein
MKKITIGLAVFILTAMTAFAQELKSTLSLTRDDLRMGVELTTEHAIFGQALPLTVTLEARRDVETFDLETGWLFFQLKKYDKGRYVAVEEQGWYRTLGGTYRYSFSPSGEHRLDRFTQKKVALHAGDALTRTFELNDLMEEFTYPGKYMLCVSYEWQIKDSVKFDVALRYESIVPQMLDYMQNSNSQHGRISPFKVITYLTGDRGLGHPVQVSEEPQLVPVIRNWWNGNKEVVLKVEATLQRPEYRNMDYNRRIAAILKAMEGADITRRIQAGEEFQRITGMILTRPPATEDEEIKKKNIQIVRQWWEQNQELVMWVSRVVIENYL